MKILLSLVMFAFIAIKVNAQENVYFNLLGKSKEQIKSDLKKTSGELKVDRFFPSMFEVPAHQHLIFTFPTDEVKNKGVYSAIFMLTPKDECFQYMIWYENDSFLKTLINQLDNSTLGFKRIGNDFKWKKNDISIEISKITSNNSSRTTAFSVQWEKTTSH